MMIKSPLFLGSSCMLNLLKGSTNIQFDGTFHVVPTISLQLFTIFTNVHDHALPAQNILMTRKTETLYRSVILSIHELIPGFHQTLAMGDF